MGPVSISVEVQRNTDRDTPSTDLFTLLLRILCIFYVFGVQNRHYESQLQNYADEKVQIFQ